MLSAPLTWRLSDATAHGSAAPGEKGRRTVGVVEVHTPRPPTAKTTRYKWFCLFRVPFILLRMNLSDLCDLQFAKLFFVDFFCQLL